MPSEASKPSGPHKCLIRMVPTEGVEPTRPRGHQILSLARLPVPPRRRKGGEYRNRLPGSKPDYSPSSARGGPKISDAIIAWRAVRGWRTSEMVWAVSADRVGRSKAGTLPR